MSFLLSTIGTGLINGGINQLFSNMSSKRQFDYWKQMQNSMNEFNSPVNQVKRFRQAGLHPGLMYSGHGGSSLQASVSPPSGGNFPGVSTDPLALSRIQNETKVSDATANRDNAQAELFRSQKTGQDNVNRTFDEEFRSRMDLIAEQIESEDLKNQWQGMTNDILSATKDTEIEKKVAELNLLIAKTDLTNEQIGQVRADISLKAATVKLNEALANRADAETWQIQQLTPKQVLFFISQIDNMDADTRAKNFKNVFNWSTLRWQRQIVKYTAEDTYQLSELHENQRLWQRFMNRNADDYLTMDWIDTGVKVAESIMPDVKINLNSKL